jgi:two-component system NtrC family response regulator
MSEGQRVTRDDVGLDADADAPPSEPPLMDLRAVREAAERKAIVAALARTNNNIAKAAETLGVSRPTLYDLMNRLMIK